MLLFSFLSFAFLTTALAQSTYSPERPPSLPLAVSSPYLSIWQAGNAPQGNGPYLPGTWPTFWAGAIIGWAGLIRVDGKVYTWLGHPTVNTGDQPSLPTVVDQVSVTYTATRTIFDLNVDGKLNLTVTFLSHHDPNDLQRQSLPFTYVDVEAWSADGKTHDVQLYSDISAEITSGNRNNTAEWKYGTYLNGASKEAKRGMKAKRFADAGADASAIPEPVPEPVAEAAADGPADNVGAENSVPDVNLGADNTPDDLQDLEKLVAEAEAFVQASSKVSGNVIFQTFGELKVSYEGWKTSVEHPSQVIPLPRKNPPLQFAVGGLIPQPSKGKDDHADSTGGNSANIPENKDATGGIAYHKLYRQTQQAFSEINDQAEWGNWYWVTDDVKELTHQSGADADVRLQFANNGYLNQTADTRYRAINDNWPVFGFSKNLGKVGTTKKSTLFGIALAQEESIQFEGKDKYAPLKSLYTQYWKTDIDAVAWFFKDYATTTTKAIGIDKKIQDDSIASHGQNLATATTLAYRQVYAAYQIAGTKEDPLTFQKEISSNGNMNTADVIFPAAPLFLYQSPSWLKSVLEPLFLNQEAGKWPYQFALHDIGTHFPNATGHSDGNAEQMPLEESGNMIILALAYAQKANDKAYLTKHYDILRQWNSYLVKDSLLPGQQLSTDDFASAISNQTNLAIKGIIGVAAFAEIAKITGHDKDAKNFRSIAEKYVKEWAKLAINTKANPPHAVLQYGNDSSHGLLYNLYADKLLNLQLVDQKIYDIQSEFYPTVINKYGVPLDTRADYTKSDWEAWTAAIASKKTADAIYGSIANFIKETVTVRPFTDLYGTITGDFPAGGPTFVARPVQGGLFASLALPKAVA